MKTKQAYESLKLALRHNGWREDKFGHFHNAGEGSNRMRVKFQANTARIERRSSGGSYWVKVTSEFFGKMTIEHGFIRVGTRTFKLPDGWAS